MTRPTELEHEVDHENDPEAYDDYTLPEQFETVDPDEVSEYDLHPDVRKEYEHEMDKDLDYLGNTHANPEEEVMLENIDYDRKNNFED